MNIEQRTARSEHRIERTRNRENQINEQRETQINEQNQL